MKLLEKANGNLLRTEEEKEQVIKDATIHYGNFLTALGFDWQNDPHSQDTPKRVTKAYVKDLIVGCYSAPPDITSFPSDYDGIIFEGGIEVKSLCSHHHAPFIGVAHIAYIPGEKEKKIIGLSKLNRVTEYFSRRPQVQEELTVQIHNYLNTVIPGNRGIAVMISATHFCACLRGVKHQGAEMKTTKLSGVFMDNNNQARAEFYNFVKDLKK